MSRRPVRRRFLLPSAVAAGLLLAVGCSGDDTATESAGSTIAAAASSTTAAAPSGTSAAAVPTTAATATAAAVASQVLLDAVAETVLAQPLAYPTAAPQRVSSSIITMQPGAETGLHRHDAPMYAYVLDGEVTVTYDGGTTKTYRAGSAIMEAVGTAHNGRNTGAVPVRILVVNIGAEGVANTVRL